MEPPVCLEGPVPGPAFSVQRFRDIHSDRARNSAVPHASFHLAQMDSVTCTGLPCFLHLFKLSVYLDLASTSQVALMIPSISTSHEKYFYKKVNSYSYKYEINVKIINNDISKEISTEFPLY